MTKAFAKKKHKPARSRWVDLSTETSLPVAVLEVLEDHHKTLNTFCTNTYSSENRIDPEEEPNASLELSFHQYCVALSTLIQYGSPAQQFEYLYHTYMTTNERGIDRTELFQLLKDHSEQAANIVMKDDKLLHVTDPRHLDKLYTWLKKHFIVFDEARSGYLPVHVALAMLERHPTALSHLKLQLVPFTKKVKENNARYASQAAAAQVSN
ncbi:hypothetical protein P3T76_007111 [Phytophthora citrophthora]|uniref:Uncharacterized protein n=1 Tax=Phytophthora citrophthora TaxID=4793 RepID=A0AAD9GMD5_9STRA|nr:hypothetical protein P3T76_007111 [Phytophthora citrophthora]